MISKPNNGSPDPQPQPTGIAILASFILPGFQVWVVGDQGSVEILSRQLRGNHLIVTVENLRSLWQAGQRRLIVPSIVPKGPIS